MKASRKVSEGLPVEQPPGEDFFVAFIRIPDDSDPCWDTGFDLLGSWQSVSRTLSAFLATDPRARRSTVVIYQGDDARRHFVEARAEEARYQEQKQAQPNN